MQKQRLNITLDHYLYIWIKTKGINISQTCEDYLKRLKERNENKKDLNSLRDEIEDVKANLTFLELEYDKLKAEEEEKEKEAQTENVKRPEDVSKRS